MSAPLLELSDLCRVYERGGVSVRAVDGVSLVVEAGELLAIEGTSGSGKSTLLAMLGGLERPTSGALLFEGRDLAELTERELTDLRAQAFGFVFQGFNLIPTLTAAQNVEAVMAPLGLRSKEQRARANFLLERVGLASRSHHLPSTLSGGEQQRVAVARALANNPRLLLADEPTGNLDSTTAADVVALLRSLATDLGVAVVLVTHDRELARSAPRRIQMRDGRIVGALRPSATVTAIASRQRPATTPRAAMMIGRAAALIALSGAGIATAHAFNGEPVAASSTVAAGPAIDVPAGLPLAPARVAPPKAPARVAPRPAATHAAPKVTVRTVSVHVPTAQTVVPRHRKPVVSPPAVARPKATPPPMIKPVAPKPKPKPKPTTKPPVVVPPVATSAPTVTVPAANPLSFLNALWWWPVGSGGLFQSP
jgi:putative ABC transport system ATP-binding protein